MRTLASYKLQVNAVTTNGDNEKYTKAQSSQSTTVKAVARRSGYLEAASANLAGIDMAFSETAEAALLD